MNIVIDWDVYKTFKKYPNILNGPGSDHDSGLLTASGYSGNLFDKV